MGLNIPAKTVVFTTMSGSVGCRDKDDLGICIIMIDEQHIQIELLLNTKFNVPSRRPITAEHVIKSSFHQFRHEQALTEIGNKMEKLEPESAMLDASGEVLKKLSHVAEYHKQRLDLALLEKKMISEITRPERVKIREGGIDWACPPRLEEKGEMHVLYACLADVILEGQGVPMQLALIAALSKLRLSIPPDPRHVDLRQSILLDV
ncbi:DExH-box ATP-dependent RNA helicase DExH10 [Bienertia sinuspersici]